MTLQPCRANDQAEKYGLPAAVHLDHTHSDNKATAAKHKLPDGQANTGQAAVCKLLTKYEVQGGFCVLIWRSGVSLSVGADGTVAPHGGGGVSCNCEYGQQAEEARRRPERLYGQREEPARGAGQRRTEVGRHRTRGETPQRYLATTAGDDRDRQRHGSELRHVRDTSPPLQRTAETGIDTGQYRDTSVLRHHRPWPSTVVSRAISAT